MLRRSVMGLLPLLCLACAPVDLPSPWAADDRVGDADEDEPETVLATPAEIPDPPEPRDSSLSDPPLTPFGGQIWGYAQASSRNGRLVLIRNFGEHEPGHFGQHGPRPSAASLEAFDLVTGDSKRVELVAMEPARRWFMLRHDAALWLVDSETGQWQALADADLEEDSNPCLLPRQGNFSPRGNRVAWIRNGARELRVRDLASGEEWSVPGDGRIWVGWPNDDDRGAVLIEVPLDSTQWPVQGTSCSCWWCNRFAMSYSNFGWDGPTFTIFAVSPDGKHSAGEVTQTNFAWHAETASGCLLGRSAMSETHGERLERGPWQWACP